MNQEDLSQSPDSAAIREAARLLYETRPGTTFDSVAAEFGISARTAKRWAAADGGWEKVAGGLELTAKAHEVADRITQAVEQVGPGEEERRAAVEAVRIEAAADERAGVIAKHRSEWGVVRGLVAEAVRSRDGAKAKLAVDVGRALTLAQQGERKAWGLDVEAPQANQQLVIIERCES